jgi:hypothetical protein
MVSPNMPPAPNHIGQTRSEPTKPRPAQGPSLSPWYASSLQPSNGNVVSKAAHLMSQREHVPAAPLCHGQSPLHRSKRPRPRPPPIRQRPTTEKTRHPLDHPRYVNLVSYSKDPGHPTIADLALPLQLCNSSTSDT